ncbi:hypothetical protein [Sorangium sp. So ce1024]
MDDWLHRAPTAFHGERIFRLGLAASHGIDERAWARDFGRAVHR